MKKYYVNIIITDFSCGPQSVAFAILRGLAKQENLL